MRFILVLLLTCSAHAEALTGYVVSISDGGTSEGPPSLRPKYHENYYGAYFRDPDGNKFCVAFHSAQY